MGGVPSKHDNVIITDAADGTESIPIEVINNFNNEPPFLYNYVTKNQLNNNGIKLLYEPTEKDGCDCQDKCHSETCRCEAFSTVTFDRVGRQITTKLNAFTSGDHHYVECGLHCACKGKCQRYLSQDTVMKKMEIYYSFEKGYTVRSRQYIAAGMPIANYVGDIITQGDYNETLDNTWNTDYTFSFTEGEHVIYCNALKSGNVTRFISHSCDPNAYMLKSYSCIPFKSRFKISLPKLVVIATRAIVPGDEITISYGTAYFEEREMQCLCYAFRCQIPPDDYQNKMKSLEKTKLERVQQNKKVVENLKHTVDIHRVNKTEKFWSKRYSLCGLGISSH